MKKVLPAAALLLTACQPNPDPDSSECSSAFLQYSLTENGENLDALGGEQINYAAITLKEMDAIEACGERGFLQKKAERLELLKNMN